ncbi:hypothetical protein Q4Q49_21970 [Shewanella sp. SP1S1-7]|uniref:hypothetical protein n=1 Tax=Shewanella sp. SP1S1-7 TaxID=3063536 RepID=UPI00288C999A|nr:hypothetical protein [Shewanella sp. SP1S1-7]MDT3337927.1 hypothetical protein [Shewanella sp. SP1S1-7]
MTDKQTTEPAPSPSATCSGSETVELATERPTCYLAWTDGVLTQMWDVTDRHLHYMGGRYTHTTYTTHQEWRPVPGQNAASSGRVKRGPATSGSVAGWPCYTEYTLSHLDC